jgi:hypothetical protein
MKFDLRLPIGILFSFYGVLLVVFGLATNSDAARYQSSLGINVNLWWGLVLLVFGALMWLGAARSGKKPRPPGQP